MKIGIGFVHVETRVIQLAPINWFQVSIFLETFTSTEGEIAAICD